MKRKIVKIDKEKCDGCGLCVPACKEGALQIIDGKAKLVSDVYCDGLGACLGECPQGAITIEEREAETFDKEKVEERLHNLQHKEQTTSETLPCGCPASAAQTLEPDLCCTDDEQTTKHPSALGNWPVQLKLLNPMASYFADADLLISADCVPFAFGNFHHRFLRDKTLIMFCPKLDPNIEEYIEKLAAIFSMHKINSITAVRMEVPCCGGLSRIAQTAIAKSGKDIALKDVVVNIKGDVLDGE